MRAILDKLYPMRLAAFSKSSRSISTRNFRCQADPEPRMLPLSGLLKRRRRLSLETIRYVLRDVLQTLDFFHTEVRATHGEISAENIFLRLDRQKNSEESRKDEWLQDELSLRGSLCLRFPYLWTAPSWSVKAILANFDTVKRFPESPECWQDSYGRYIDVLERERVSHPNPYTLPPEYVFLPINEIGSNDTKWACTAEQSPYNASCDIWAIGILAINLAQTYPPFQGTGSNDDYAPENHIAQLCSLLGTPPAKLISGSRYAHYFDLNGIYLGCEDSWHEDDLEYDEENDHYVGVTKAGIKMPVFDSRDFEEADFRYMIQVIDAPSQLWRDRYIEFLRRILQWEPQQRPSARDLLNDRFLRV